MPKPVAGGDPLDPRAPPPPTQIHTLKACGPQAGLRRPSGWHAAGTGGGSPPGPALPPFGPAARRPLAALAAALARPSAPTTRTASGPGGSTPPARDGGGPPLWQVYWSSESSRAAGPGPGRASATKAPMVAGGTGHGGIVRGKVCPRCPQRVGSRYPCPCKGNVARDVLYPSSEIKNLVGDKKTDLRAS